ANGGGPLLITAIGGTLQLTASPKDLAGHPVQAADFSWRASDPVVATVDASGLVTAIGNGTAGISVVAGGATGVATITVAQAAESIAVVPASRSIERGATASFTASVVDSRGNSVAGSAITWTSQSAAIVAISAQGVVTGVAVGSTTVTGTSGGKSASASVTVTVPAPAAVALSPAQTGPFTSLDETRQLTATATDSRGATIPEAAF